jgi:hypothetical protein
MEKRKFLTLSGLELGPPRSHRLLPVAIPTSLPQLFSFCCNVIQLFSSFLTVMGPLNLNVAQTLACPSPALMSMRVCRRVSLLTFVSPRAGETGIKVGQDPCYASFSLHGEQNPPEITRITLLRSHREIFTEDFQLYSTLGNVITHILSVQCLQWSGRWHYTSTPRPWWFQVNFLVAQRVIKHVFL